MSRVAVYATWYNTHGQRWHHLVRVMLQRGHRVHVFSGRGIRDIGSSEHLKNLGDRDVQHPSLHPRTWLSPRLFGPRLAAFYNRIVTRSLENDFFLYDADVHVYCGIPPARIARKPRFLVFDCVDDYRQTPWVEEDAALLENQMARQADLITVVSPPLMERFSKTEPDKVLLAPNGADISHFAASAHLRVKRDRPGRVFGYMGCLNYWFHGALVNQVLNILSDWQFLIVGNTMELPAEQWKWLEHSRIHYLGQVSFMELPEFLARIDVGIIPFQQTQIVRSTSPIKLYEYLAAGLPVVATSMPDVLDLKRRGFVYCADTADDFAALIEKAISEGDPVDRQRFASQFSWETRFQSLFERCGL
jgi:glycosyltransferase involved in cell wall biosynthesis